MTSGQPNSECLGSRSRFPGGPSNLAVRGAVVAVVVVLGTPNRGVGQVQFGQKYEREISIWTDMIHMVRSDRGGACGRAGVRLG